MKILVVCYSLTGNTNGVAEKLAKCLKADFEELVDFRKRDGKWGYVKGGFASLFKRGTVIGDLKYNPRDYDFVVLASPIWVGTFAPAVREFLKRNPLEKAGFVCTRGGGEINRALIEFKKRNIDVEDVLIVNEKGVKKDNFDKDVREFCKKLKDKYKNSSKKEKKSK